MAEENFLSKAFRIIAEELPQFFTQTNTPFLGQDVEGSVMKEDKGSEEKRINENLLSMGALAVPAGIGAAAIGRAAMAAPKLAGALASGGTFAVTKDPLDLVPGKLGMVIGSTGDAEAMIVPAAKVRTADQIKNALTALDLGRPAEKVYAGTGIYKGLIDEVPRVVISDQKASLFSKEAGTLNDILYHPDLFKAMPELKDIKVGHLTEEQAKKIKGGYLPGDNSILIDPNLDSRVFLSTLLHETQHVIQNNNKMITGGSPSIEETTNRFAEAYDKFAQKLGPNANPAERKALYQTLRKLLYKQGAGEAEARATQNMWETGNYTAFPLNQDESKFIPYDIPINRVIKPATRMFEDI
jgi:hypothetical protein